MADVFRTVGRVFDLSPKNDEGTAQYILGDAHDGRVSTWSVHIQNVNAAVISIVVKARTRIDPPGSAAPPTFQPTIYRKLYLNGAVGDGTLVNVPITGESIILIPADGLDIALDTTYTSGQARVYSCPLEGPSVI